MVYSLLLVDGVSFDDSCLSAVDGYCGECGVRPLCSLGTDTTDCLENPCFKFNVIHASPLAPNKGDIITSSKIRECRPMSNGRDAPPGCTLEVFYGDGWIKDVIWGRVYLEQITDEYNPPYTISNNSSELKDPEKKDSFFDSILFQGLVAYCSCIFCDRLKKGYMFILENIRIIIETITCIFMCFLYSVTLFATISMIFIAIEDKDKEIEVLKIMALISFIDYIH